jgi:hypothetical protein
MKPISAWMALALSVTGCAGQVGPPAVADPKGDQRPMWQQQMDLARHHAAAGRAYDLVVTSLRAGTSGSGAGVYTFYNNPRPFCYTYMIPGEWVAGPHPASYHSKDGRAFVGVLFESAKRLGGVEGATLVERARNAMTRWYAKVLGQPPAAAKWEPFESARTGTWKWAGLPETRIIVDLSPDAVMHITASDWR